MRPEALRLCKCARNCFRLLGIDRRLVAAGFSTGVIYKILRQWDVLDEALAALDNLSSAEDEPHER